MLLTKRAIKPIAKIHGYWIYKRFLRETETWDLERQRAYVFRLLKKMLVQANENVPFYKRRFKEIGFDPNSDFESVDVINKIPTLTKQELRENSVDLIDKRFLAGSVTASTSGSTGEPTQLRLGEGYIALDYACMFRHWAKAGYSFWKRFGALRTYVPKRVGDPEWRFSLPQNTLYLSAYQLRRDTFERYLLALLRYKPKFLRGYPSALAVFADLAFDRRNELGFVQGVFTASETLSVSERKTIEKTFGSVVFDWYGMTEPAVVITECFEQDRMRVEWVYGYPEFQKISGGDGMKRHLLATSLHNPVMPLIRYETGDVVELVSSEPRDGELYPDIRRIYGRKDQVIRTREGGRLPSLNFYSLLQDFEQIIRFQFIQPSIDRVEVRLIFRTETESREKDAIMETLVDAIGVRLGGSVDLKITESTEFVQSGEGKIVPFVIGEF